MRSIYLFIKHTNQSRWGMARIGSIEYKFCKPHFQFPSAYLSKNVEQAVQINLQIAYLRIVIIIGKNWISTITFNFHFKLTIAYRSSIQPQYFIQSNRQREVRTGRDNLSANNTKLRSKHPPEISRI